MKRRDNSGDFNNDDEYAGRRKSISAGFGSIGQVIHSVKRKSMSLNRARLSLGSDNSSRNAHRHSIHAGMFADASFQQQQQQENLLKEIFRKYSFSFEMMFESAEGRQLIESFLDDNQSSGKDDGWMELQLQVSEMNE